MKTRNGFVSNSSSSSFIIFGNRLDAFHSVEDKDVKDGTIYCQGNEHSEGVDFFKVTPEIFKFLKGKQCGNEEKMYGLSFYKVYMTLNEQEGLSKGELREAMKDIPDSVTFNIMDIERSNHSSYSLADVRETYFGK